MDRYDEAKHINSTDDTGPRREGDILGLGNSVVPKAPGDPSTEYDEDSVRRRRERASGEDEVVEERRDDSGHGATGIDMGSGGTGTDISGR
jgi:hypothetical protein